jgi:flagellar secretion chaperone FliS
MPESSASYGAYKRVDVETASQGKLIVMLLNGAIQRAEEAKRQAEKGRNDAVHNNLIRAQDIVNELRSALDMKAGDIAHGLDRVYEYCQHLLVQANIRKSPVPIEECVEHLTGLRDTWQELFEKMAKEEPAAPPQIRRHGETALNLEG